MVIDRILPHLLLPIGATLALAAWWSVGLVQNVAGLRAELGQRVIWMIEIQHVQEAAVGGASELDQAMRSLEEARGGMRGALGADPEAMAAFETFQAGLQDPVGIDEATVEAGYTLVTSLRRQTAALSRELDGYWSSLNRLVLWSIGLSVACMGLLAHLAFLRAREDRRPGRAESPAIEALQRGSAIRRFLVDVQGIVESLPVGVAVLSAEDGRTVRYANPELARIVGRQDPDDLEGTRLALGEELETSQPVAMEWSGSPARLLVVRDRARARVVEARRRLEDRLASIGTMAAGVAHEINNPLTWIGLDLDELARRLAGRPEVEELVHPILDGIERIRGIVADLATFAGSDSEVPIDDLVDVLRAVARTTTVAGDDEVLVEVSGPQGVTVKGPGKLLAQLFSSLVTNAVQASSVGGSNRAVPAPVRLVVARPLDGFVTVDVSDEGPGVPERHRERIFDPFFTTRPFGEGRGLGLFAAHQIAEGLGGRVELLPSRRGATFRVTLPAA